MKRILQLLISLVIAGPESCLRAQASPQPVPAAALSIEEVTNEALDRNLDLVAEKYNLSVAEARMITARLRPNPVISIGEDYLDLLGTGYNAENQAGPPEYSLRTDFLFERGHKRESRIAVAENSRAVAELQFLNTMRTLTLDIENAFVEVQLAKENLVLAEDSLRAFGDIVRVNQIRVKSGDLAEVELLDVQRPLATVVVGGLLSTLFLTLLALPSMYYLVERGREQRP